MTDDVGFVDEPYTVTDGVDGVDRCSGDTSSGAIDLSTIFEVATYLGTDASCFEFTNGITDDPWGNGPEVIDTCT